jgi:hypothetical protein
MTILATITIITTLSVSLFFTQLSAATATTYNANKMTVTGVLASDSYVLFPFDKANLIFGFSKYGELINGEVGQANGQGLEYKGLDVFANPNVYEKDWSQGWFIDIHYADNDNNYKRAWAFAMYSDLSGSTGIGGDWKENCTLGPTGLPDGGRKTNVWATTDPIKVLYDGPRQFVALTKTTLYGSSYKTADDALVSITITFVFNKDEKVVTLFKDIKRLDLGKFSSTFQVEFSNRGEWDIGNATAPPSYAHFYDNLPTAYDADYHDFYVNSSTTGYINLTGYDMCQMIDKGGSYVGFAAFWPQLFGKLVQGTSGDGKIGRTTILSSLSTKEYNQTWSALGSPSRANITFVTHGEVAGLGWPTADPSPRGAGASSDDPMVFKNGKLLAKDVHYTWDSVTDEIVFTTEPLDTDYITVVYKHQVPTLGGVDDMNTHTIEPKTPYVIGEWVFDLQDMDQKRQFRAVTVYGLTDRHDADDDNTLTADQLPLGWSSAHDVIDSEVQYYLNETFNPYDLYSAVEKQEYRWVKIQNLTSTLTAGTNYTLTSGLDDQLYYAVMLGEYTSIDRTSAGWTGYFIKEGATGAPESTWVNTFQNGTGVSHSKNWALLLNSSNAQGGSDGYEMLKVTPTVGTPTTTAPLTLQLKDLVDFDFWYKFVGTTGYGPHIEIKVSSSAAGGETGTLWANIAAENSNPQKSTTTWTHYTLNNITGFTAGPDADTAFFVTGKSGAEPVTVGEKHSYEYFTADSKLGNYYVNSIGIQTQDGAIAYVDDLSVGYLNRASGIRYERVYNMEEDKVIPCKWDAYSSFAERVLINSTLAYPYRANSTFGYYNYTIDFAAGNITFVDTLSAGTRLKILYSTIEENEKGRYEWMVVGKGAATVDSLGAAYMTEAFDSKKDIDVLLTGLDINDTANGPRVPFVMGRAATGTAADYRDTLGRVHLGDDWCTTYPVASSDMLFSGGPEVNVGAEYFNEFTNAFWARTEYVVNDTGQAYKILALSCWNKTSYGSGYAVVSVYKDLNGTIGFLIWGVTGSDTYYAAKWFWETGIEYLQGENRGVTDIILKITYPPLDPTHPTISYVQRLGTISEKTPHDP